MSSWTTGKIRPLVLDVQHAENSVCLALGLDADLFQFQGHFPNNPIMPGVLIIEAMAQLSGILGFVTVGRKPSDGLVQYLAGSSKARFKRPVLPGDRLCMESEIISEKRGIWKFDCRALVDGEVVCVAEILTAEREV